MNRLFIIVMDSFGIGSSKDANKFGDEGSNTLGNIARYCQNNIINNKKKGLLKLPNLTMLGLANAAKESSGFYPIGLNNKRKIIGAYSYASEISSGKDTISGHWEIAGVPVLFNWDYFKKKKNSFPLKLLKLIIQSTNLPGFLGNCHSSGTIILEKLGKEHILTGKPIIYTSSDSVFQIACHENYFGLKRLYNLCKITRKILFDYGYNIGRVIARPFTGEINNFKRTENRKDLATVPPNTTVLQKLIEEKNGTVVSIGKVADIYAQLGISKKVKANGINNLFDATIKEIKIAKNNTLVFTNFVDFDSLYGHRRDVRGYASELEIFDKRLPEIISLIKNNDILIITSDHGCDPTWHGTEHTRENIPILIYSPKINPGFYGHRKTFADIGQTIANYFGLSKMEFGEKII